MVRAGFGIFSKLCLILSLTFLLNIDAELVEISPKLLQKCSEGIRAISPMETMNGNILKKWTMFGEGKDQKTFRSKRPLSGSKTWGKRESPRPRPLRHGKRSESLSMERKGVLPASQWEPRQKIEKSWKTVSALLI